MDVWVQEAEVVDRREKLAAEAGMGAVEGGELVIGESGGQRWLRQ